MNEDVLKHLFEPFFTTKAVGQGTGLGLASVYGTVQQHHGWLNVESRPEQGTTVRLYLPRSPHSPKPEAGGTPKGASVDTKGKGETLLLVENEPALLAIATRALSRLGYRVLPAVDGRQALALWECYANDIDLVLTDMRMPNGINGLALAERLWSTKPSLKIIIMSGYSSEMATNGTASQVEFTYLAKPFELETLATTIRRAIG
jgi:CheY-like chemotaxis protein